MPPHSLDLSHLRFQAIVESMPLRSPRPSTTLLHPSKQNQNQHQVNMPLPGRLHLQPHQVLKRQSRMVVLQSLQCRAGQHWWT